MAVLKIARMGHPVLARRADEVEDPKAPEIRRLIADMLETLEDADGAGLAAPQVHVPLRVVMFRVPEGRATADEHDGGVPLTVLINPVIEPLGDEMDEGWEACLSLPGLMGLVPRYRNIRYSGLDPEGNTVARIAAGFHARVVQHECDHLDGMLYPLRMNDLSKLGFVEEMRRRAAPPRRDGETEESDEDAAETVEV